MGKKKGGKVQGRAKQKQKAQKSSPGGKPPWMKSFIRSFDDNDNSNTTFRGFAQRSGDEGPRTGPPQKLRHQTINFVSAGSNTPPRPEEAEDGEIAAAAGESTAGEQTLESDDDDDLEDSKMQTNIMADTDVDIAQGTEAMHIHERTEMRGLDGTTDVQMDVEATVADKPPTPPETETLSFVVDTEGDPALSRPQKGKARLPIRAASPTPSDSSEEVILFHGRNRPRTVEDPVSRSSEPAARASAHAPGPKQSSHAPTQQQAKSHITDDLLEALGVPPGEWASKPQRTPGYVETTEGFTPAPEYAWWRKGAARPDMGPSKAGIEQLKAAAPIETEVASAEPEAEEDAEQTIESLQAAWNDTRREKKREKMEAAHVKSHENEKVKLAPRTTVAAESSRRGKRGRKRNNKLLRRLQEDQSDNEDEEEKAYDDYMENIKRQLDAGELEGMPGDGNAPTMYDDDEEDSSSSDSDIIGQDRSEIDDDDYAGMNASDFDSSDLESEIANEEREMWEDEEDLRERRQNAMTDEHIARLFATQIEHGIDGDELVLDDGMYMDEDEDDVADNEIEQGIGDVDEAKAGLDALVDISFGQPKGGKNKGKGKAKGRKSGDFAFPDASALADSLDQYGHGGFDIMDFERPSLRPRPKGRSRKNSLPPELAALSDDDLRDEMQATWSSDRAKKRLKKAEREELRAEGLLGSASKKGKADLSQKYLQGMTTAQIHAELRLFLMDEAKTTRAFPPMDKGDRKALHDIANALNLKSKSVGGGKNRAPVLYKTSRTVDFEEATFARVSRASQRGFLKNSASKGKGRGTKLTSRGGAGGGRGGRGGGASMGAVGLRHGEVVGAGAKAIGNESFGHRLMEKMGWTSGTALGKERDGLLVPVQQVMRTGKTGLG